MRQLSDQVPGLPLRSATRAPPCPSSITVWCGWLPSLALRSKRCEFPSWSCSPVVEHLSSVHEASHPLSLTHTIACFLPRASSLTSPRSHPFQSGALIPIPPSKLPFAGSSPSPCQPHCQQPQLLMQSSSHPGNFGHPSFLPGLPSSSLHL